MENYNRRMPNRSRILKAGLIRNFRKDVNLLVYDSSTYMGRISDWIRIMEQLCLSSLIFSQEEYNLQSMERANNRAILFMSMM